MSSNIPHPLETLKYVENQIVSQGDAHLIQTLLKIEKEFSSSCNAVLVDEHQSQLHHFLDTLQWVETKCGSFRIFLDNIHLLETLNRVEDQWGSFDYDMFSEEPYILITTLPQLAQASRSFAVEYLSMLSHLRGTLQQNEDECNSLYRFLDEYLFARELDTLTILLRIEEEWGSFSDIGFNFSSGATEALTSFSAISIKDKEVDAVNLTKIMRCYLQVFFFLLTYISYEMRQTNRHVLKQLNI